MEELSLYESLTVRLLKNIAKSLAISNMNHPAIRMDEESQKLVLESVNDLKDIQEDYNQYLEEVAERLTKMADEAEKT